MLWWKNTKRNNYWKRRPISSQKTRKKLFGKAFHEDCCSDLKTKQKYQQDFRNETKSSSPRGKTSFRGSSPASSGRSGRRPTPQAYFVRPALHKQYGKSTYNTLPQNSLTRKCRNIKSAYFDKESFRDQGTIRPVSGKTKVSFKKFWKINVRWEYLIKSSGAHNILYPKLQG